MQYVGQKPTCLIHLVTPDHPVLIYVEVCARSTLYEIKMTNPAIILGRKERTPFMVRVLAAGWEFVLQRTNWNCPLKWSQRFVKLQILSQTLIKWLPNTSSVMEHVLASLDVMTNGDIDEIVQKSLNPMNQHSIIPNCECIWAHFQTCTVGKSSWLD